MRKGLIFFLGIVTGCVLTIAVLFVIGITNSNANESDITIAEQQTVFTTATKFEVYQVSTLIRICSKCNFVSTKRMRPDAPVYITSAKLNIFSLIG